MAKDSIGRQWQVATIQLDSNMPERFDLFCINEEGKQERIVMIHAAIMGSIERFLSVLIEHYAGAFPTWLSPTQVSVIPVKESHEEEADRILKILQDESVRVEKISGNESLGKRIHGAKKMNTPYVIILGDKEKDSGMLTIEKRDGSKIEMKVEDFKVHILSEIKSRS
jgi:threonyl-tRNA synthetase